MLAIEYTTDRCQIDESEEYGQKLFQDTQIYVEFVNELILAF